MPVFLPLVPSQARGGGAPKGAIRVSAEQAFVLASTWLAGVRALQWVWRNPCRRAAFRRSTAAIFGFGAVTSGRGSGLSPVIQAAFAAFPPHHVQPLKAA